jgi:hypothetical protein
MSRDAVHVNSLRQMVTECKDVFRLKCRNTPLLIDVTSTADELTSFVYSALLLGCRVSVAEENRGI